MKLFNTVDRHDIWFAWFPVKISKVNKNFIWEDTDELAWLEFVNRFKSHWLISPRYTKIKKK
jgi:hypothetical protein